MSDPVPTSGASKRPRLLTALCILSFFGCGSMLVGGVMGYSAYKAQAASSERLELLINGSDAPGDPDDMGDKDAPESFEGEMANLNAMALLSLSIGSLSILVFIGTWLMWKVRKLGFYVYALGQLATLVAPLILVGSFTGLLMTLLLAAFPVLFIVLYATQLKHMR